jgi:hypothetical protein
MQSKRKQELIGENTPLRIAIKRNKSYYRSSRVRPPFVYVPSQKARKLSDTVHSNLVIRITATANVRSLRKGGH